KNGTNKWRFSCQEISTVQASEHVIMGTAVSRKARSGTMGRLLFFTLVVMMVVRQGYTSCPPIPDRPTARLMYTSISSTHVGPTSPLEDGTVAKLKCPAGQKATGTATATCAAGKWIGLPLGDCSKV
ncbi:Sushi domain-containing protein, partial [Trichostrongylus colubriformis]